MASTSVFFFFFDGLIAIIKKLPYGLKKQGSFSLNSRRNNVFMNPLDFRSKSMFDLEANSGEVKDPAHLNFWSALDTGGVLANTYFKKYNK